ncbi:hypothetical protein HQO38_17535 [Rhodococcus fascians]|nr:hypothetical protein [Rhodococcus fascians]MBY4217691.1 hypothetical protein [Rhodococcus fascians]MBY4224571.1 hypothetical protein [Rhodococcus fascians]MBY4233721.1 hypothetical protein [Rhodococcus fascians]MBY4245280.1 hypothetical protein [Rhodococcus fascians]
MPAMTSMGRKVGLAICCAALTSGVFAIAVAGQTSAASTIEICIGRPGKCGESTPTTSNGPTTTTVEPTTTSNDPTTTTVEPTTTSNTPTATSSDPTTTTVEPTTTSNTPTATSSDTQRTATAEPKSSADAGPPSVDGELHSDTRYSEPSTVGKTVHPLEPRDAESPASDAADSPESSADQSPADGSSGDEEPMSSYSQTQTTSTADPSPSPSPSPTPAANVDGVIEEEDPDTELSSATSGLHDVAPLPVVGGVAGLALAGFGAGVITFRGARATEARRSAARAELFP